MTLESPRSGAAPTNRRAPTGPRATASSRHLEHTLRTAALLGCLLVPARALAEDPTVEPYLQLAASDSIWVSWEMPSEAEGSVQWWPAVDPSDTNTVESTVLDLRGGGLLHEAQLDGLAPSTRYGYRVSSGDWTSVPRTFVTPPDGEGTGLNLVAMSDMQRDGREPDKFREIVEEGVIPWVEERVGLPIDEALGMVLIPGDLVDDGDEHEHWTEHFFAPSRALFSQVPVYPVPGNHERNSHFFFDYFRLPTNETRFYDEHWWAWDYANVRIIGLDTNEIYRVPPQLDWLDATLEATCDDARIDFVFAQFHHPAQSELWIPGEAGFSGVVVRRLEEFSSRCGKPSIHFYGHTHGYARGQSRDHQHLWVNVATAGGSIDDWGEYAQVDYPETTISEDEYGFVFVEVTAGPAPEFVLERVSRGKPGAARDNEVSDSLRVRRDNQGPRRPRPAWPAGSGVASECATFGIASEYEDPDGDALQGVHWQVSDACPGFESVLAEEWVQASNLYFGEDTQAGVALDQLELLDLPPSSELCWRVRWRDEGLAWSEWSVAVPFATSADGRSSELLINGGAEADLEGWTTEEGTLESLAAEQCGSGFPATGTRFFSVGGVCAAGSQGSARQRVDLAPFATEVAAGASLEFRARFATYDGADAPSAHLEFFDADAAPLGASDPIGSARARWESRRSLVEIPAGAVAVDVVMSGVDGGRAGNHSYIDDLSLRLFATEVPDCAARGDGEVPPDPEPADPRQDADPGADAGADAGSADAGDASDSSVDDPGTSDGGDGGADGSGGLDAGQGGSVRGGGCDGCTSGATREPPGAAWILVLAAALARRRRTPR